MDPARNRTGKWMRPAAWLLVVPGCYLAYLLGIAFGPVQSESNPPESKATAIRLANGLEVAAADLDLGEVWEHPEFVRPVTITNRGTSDAVVTNLTGGCECTAIEPTNFTLAPGQSRLVNVKIDLTHRFPHQFGMDRRELAVTVSPTLASRGVSAEAWKVTGVIKSRVSLESRGLEFGDMCSSGGPPVSRKMRATVHVPLKGLDAYVPTGLGRAEVRPVPGKPDRYDIVVTPNPDRPQGPFKFDVALTATGEDGVTSPASFHVQGEMVSPVRIVPNPVLLGEHPVGTRLATTITVDFPESGWRSYLATTDWADTQVMDVGLVDSRSTFKIVHTVAMVGDYQRTVRVHVEGPDGRRSTISTRLSIHGDATP